MCSKIGGTLIENICKGVPLANNLLYTIVEVCCTYFLFRGQKSEDRWQKTEDRGQKAEVRG
ncbi:MAG: hypothetical protein JRE23_15455 [Deltaproteobacteria bacterium]|nr:hypothetical protein [Deltaproteobacteria bacterium]